MKFISYFFLFLGCALYFIGESSDISTVLLVSIAAGVIRVAERLEIKRKTND